MADETAVLDNEPLSLEDQGSIDPADFDIQPTEDSATADDVQIPSEDSADTTSDDTEQPSFDEALLRQSGLTAEQAAAKGWTPEHLEAALRFHDEQMIAAGRQARQQPLERPQQRAEDNRQVEQVTEPKVSFQFDTEGWDDDSKKLLAKYGSSIEQGVKSVISPVTQKLAAAEQQLELVTNVLRQMIGDQRSQQQMQADRRFDEAINALPEEYQAVFGKGYLHELDPQGPEIQARVRFHAAFQDLQDGRHSKGVRPYSYDDNFQRALQAEFSHIATKKAVGELSGKVSNRQKQFAARPSNGRKGDELTPEQKATRRVRETMKALNIPDHSLGDEGF